MFLDQFSDDMKLMQIEILNNCMAMIYEAGTTLKEFHIENLLILIVRGRLIESVFQKNREESLMMSL